MFHTDDPIMDYFKWQCHQENELRKWKVEHSDFLHNLEETKERLNLLLEKLKKIKSKEDYEKLLEEAEELGYFSYDHNRYEELELSKWDDEYNVEEHICGAESDINIMLENIRKEYDYLDEE